MAVRNKVVMGCCDLCKPTGGPLPIVPIHFRRIAVGATGKNLTGREEKRYREVLVCAEHLEGTEEVPHFRENHVFKAIKRPWEPVETLS